MSQPNTEDAELLTSGTAAGLYKFFDLAIKRGDIGQSTGIALRSASKKVLEIEADQDLDLRTLDQEDLLRRFHVKSKIDLNDQSRATYESRFRRAVEMYLKYLSDDSTWKPAVRSKSRTSKSTTTKSVTTPVTEIRKASTSSNGETDAPPVPGMIEFPIPLRPGVQGRLILPDDLTKKEAERVVKVVSALAIEEHPSLPSPTTGDA